MSTNRAQTRSAFEPPQRWHRLVYAPHVQAVSRYYMGTDRCLKITVFQLTRCSAINLMFGQLIIAVTLDLHKTSTTLLTTVTWTRGGIMSRIMALGMALWHSESGQSTYFRNVGPPRPYCTLAVTQDTRFRRGPESMFKSEPIRAFFRIWPSLDLI